MMIEEWRRGEMREESTQKLIDTRYKCDVICLFPACPFVNEYIIEPNRWGVTGVNEKDWEDGMDLGFKGSNMLQTGNRHTPCEL